MKEVDNYNFVKVMMVFISICIFGFGAIMLFGYLDGDGVSSATYPEGFPEITPNNGYVETVGPTPTPTEDKTLYKYSIDGVKYNGTISIDNKPVYNGTVKVMLMNATVVGNDKDNVTLYEFMRDDGLIFTRIVDTRYFTYDAPIGTMIDMDADSVNIYPYIDIRNIGGDPMDNK